MRKIAVADSACGAVTSFPVSPTSVGGKPRRDPPQRNSVIEGLELPCVSTSVYFVNYGTPLPLPSNQIFLCLIFCKLPARKNPLNSTCCAWERRSQTKCMLRSRRRRCQGGRSGKSRPLVPCRATAPGPEALGRACTRRARARVAVGGERRRRRRKESEWATEISTTEIFSRNMQPNMCCTPRGKNGRATFCTSPSTLMHIFIFSINLILVS